MAVLQKRVGLELNNLNQSFCALITKILPKMFHNPLLPSENYIYDVKKYENL